VSSTHTTIPSESLKGTYLSTENPIPCTGHITEWQYCYSTAAVTDESTYLATVGVWTPYLQDYIPLLESIVVITEETTILDPQTICRAINIDSGIMVSKGDVIGVLYPFSNSLLPIVTRDVPGVSLTTSPNNSLKAGISMPATAPLPNTSLNLQITLSEF